MASNALQRRDVLSCTDDEALPLDSLEGTLSIPRLPNVLSKTEDVDEVTIKYENVIDTCKVENEGDVRSELIPCEDEDTTVLESNVKKKTEINDVSTHSQNDGNQDAVTIIVLDSDSDDSTKEASAIEKTSCNNNYISPTEDIEDFTMDENTMFSNCSSPFEQYQQFPIITSVESLSEKSDCVTNEKSEGNSTIINKDIDNEDALVNAETTSIDSSQTFDDINDRVQFSIMKGQLKKQSSNGNSNIICFENNKKSNDSLLLKNKMHIFRCSTCIFAAKTRFALARHLESHKETIINRNVPPAANVINGGCSSDAEVETLATTNSNLVSTENETLPTRINDHVASNNFISNSPHVLKTHQNENSLYDCNFCSFVAKTESGLKNHISKHKNISTVCSWCQDLVPKEKMNRHRLSCKPASRGDSESKFPESNNQVKTNLKSTKKNIEEVDLVVAKLLQDLNTNEEDSEQNEENKADQAQINTLNVSNTNERDLKQDKILKRSTKKVLENHRQSIHQENVLTYSHKEEENCKYSIKCPYCSHSSSDARDLKKHIRLHTESNAPIIKCKECNFRSTKHALGKHVRKVHMNKSNSIRNEKSFLYKCPYCSYTTNLSFNLRKHTLLHTKTNATVSKCPQCNFRSTALVLALHVKQIHGKQSLENNKKTVRCQYCSYTTTYFGDLNKHLELHKRNEPIIKCKSSNFRSTKRVLLEHKKVCHAKSEELKIGQLKKIRRCPFCSYTTRHNLRRHLVLHTKYQRPVLKCDKCDFRSTHMVLARHMSKVHNKKRSGLEKSNSSNSQTNINFKTDVEKSLPNAFKLHEVVNKTDSPVFLCEVCDFETNDKLKMITHKSNHTEFRRISDKKRPSVPEENSRGLSKLYKKSLNLCSCIFCKDIFMNSTMFDKHECGIYMFNRKNRTYKCNFCSYSGFYRNNTMRHITSMHKESQSFFKCFVCNFTTKYGESIKKHLIHLHNIDCSTASAERLICSLCNFNTVNEYILKAHTIGSHPTNNDGETKISENVPDVKYKCDICGFQTDFEETLKNHKIQHINTKKVKHNLNKNKTSNVNLNKPSDVIEKEPITYTCSDCTFSTLNRRSLINHRSKRHLIIKNKNDKIKPIKLKLSSLIKLNKSNSTTKQVKHGSKEKVASDESIVQKDPVETILSEVSNKQYTTVSDELLELFNSKSDDDTYFVTDNNQDENKRKMSESNKSDRSFKKIKYNLTDPVENVTSDEPIIKSISSNVPEDQNKSTSVSTELLDPFGNSSKNIGNHERNKNKKSRRSSSSSGIKQRKHSLKDSKENSSDSDNPRSLTEARRSSDVYDNPNQSALSEDLLELLSNTSCSNSDHELSKYKKSNSNSSVKKSKYDVSDSMETHSNDSDNQKQFTQTQKGELFEDSENSSRSNTNTVLKDDKEKIKKTKTYLYCQYCDFKCYLRIQHDKHVETMHKNKSNLSKSSSLSDDAQSKIVSKEGFFNCGSCFYRSKYRQNVSKHFLMCHVEHE